ncbi:ROK family protein [Jonesia quinghaiensis]|uniref:ROK family protein n=1 Tax=Jonesia quinghaiensis TaxID=262806 RepID=UPI0004264701|nr:ROK family protein [Jonesia quinghaiensis]
MNPVSDLPLPLAGHERAIVRSLLLDGPQTRTELARDLDLSAGSLTRLTRPLLETKLITEQAATQSPTGVGRPSVPLAFEHDSCRVIGIKLTESHSHAALTTADARVERTITLPLVNSSSASVMATMTTQVAQLLQWSQHPVLGVGVTLGGHVSRYQTVTRADYLGWDNLDLATELGERVGLPVTVENDIIAQTELSAWFGEGRGCDRFALFTLGAGIGFGLVAHGRSVSNTEAGFSLLTHHRLLSEELLDRAPNTRYVRGACGHLACAATLFTSREISRRGSAALGRQVTAEQVLGLARAADPAARLLVDVSAFALGQFLASVANMTLPERIILGGEMCEIADIARGALDEGMRSCRDPRTTNPPVYLQDPDISSWSRGAAVLAVQNLLIGRAS